MSTQVTNYKCPSCTGPLKFSSQSGKLQCEYCDSIYDVEVIELLYEDKNAAAAAAKKPEWNMDEAGSPWSDAEAEGLKVYNCPSCGAEIICDETTVATSCVYCGNPTVVPGQLGGNLKPDFVIPFKLDKEQAKQALKKHYEKKPLLPKLFKSQNRIEEIKGVYVPFWLFDCDVDAKIQYKAEKVKRWRTNNEEITETSFYHVVRQGNLGFEKIPVDGSKNMPDAHMDAIEPFNYQELTSFSTAYLPGFFADKYDLQAEECVNRANIRIENSTTDAFASTMSEYDKWTVDWADIDMKHGEVHYALLPVWMLATKWNGEEYLFAMNGQSGKLIGDLPVSKKRMTAYFFGIWAVATAVISVLALLMQNM